MCPARPGEEGLYARLCVEVEAGQCESEVVTQVDHDIGRTFALCGDGDAQAWLR